MWSATVPTAAGAATTTQLAGVPGSGSFTITGDSRDQSTSASDAGVGKSDSAVSLHGFSIGLADTSFHDGILVLTIAIGANDAGFAFGGSSGIKATLTGIQGTFDIDVDVLKAVQAINDPQTLLAAFSVPGKFSLKVAGLTVKIPGALEVTASQINVTYDPAYKAAEHANQPQTLVTVDAAKLPSLNNLTAALVPVCKAGTQTVTCTTTNKPVGCTSGDFGCTTAYSCPPQNGGAACTKIPGLTVYDNGFFLGELNVTITPTTPIGIPGIVEFKDLRLGVRQFGVTFNNGGVQFHGGADGESGITIASSGADFLKGQAVSGSITHGPNATDALSATLIFGSDGSFKSLIFTVDTLKIDFNGFLVLTAHNFKLNTGAGPTEPLVHFDSIGADLKTLGIGGEARNFEFLGNGSFKALNGFGVFLNADNASGDSIGWMKQLPIKITTIGIQWRDINGDPSDFVLTVSASVTGIQGLGGLTFDGAVEGIQIDVGKLKRGEFPIIGLTSIGVHISGTLFGGTIDAGLIGGMVKLDANGAPISDTDISTPVKDRVLFLGLQGSFSFGEIGPFSIRLALSSLGPLTVFLSVNLPTGITLDPDTGLTLNNFAGGVQFFHTLPSIEDPIQLRGPAFQAPTNVSVENWLSTVKQQVVAQYLAIQANPSQGGWGAAFTSPMTIIGSATIYSIYTSQKVFNGVVTVEISTDGKLLVIGTLNFADNHLSMSGRLYADFSHISQGSVTVLFLADIPDQVRVLTFYGKLKMGFKNAQGQDVAFTVPDSTPSSPTATLAGPRDAGTVNGTSM
jgi:carbon monoxide dehydrogenase subunit G